MANGDEKFNVGGVKGKMTVIEGYFSDFATTLSDINAFVQTNVNASLESAAFGDLGGKLLNIWDYNASTFNDFHENFDNWAQVVAIIAANNNQFAVDALATYRDNAGTLDGVQEARAYVAANNGVSNSGSNYGTLSNAAKSIIDSSIAQGSHIPDVVNIFGGKTVKEDDGTIKYYDKDGNLVSYYKDGKYYDKDGNEIGDAAAYRKWLEEHEYVKPRNEDVTVTENNHFGGKTIMKPDGTYEFYDKDGNLIASRKGDTYYDADGKEIGDAEAYRKWLEEKGYDSGDKVVNEDNNFGGKTVEKPDGTLEYYDKDGKLIASYRDGKYFDASGKEIGDAAAYRKWLEDNGYNKPAEQELPGEEENPEPERREDDDGVYTSEVADNKETRTYEDGTKKVIDLDDKGNPVKAVKYDEKGNRVYEEEYGADGKVTKKTEWQTKTDGNVWKKVTENGQTKYYDPNGHEISEEDFEAGRPYTGGGDGGEDNHENENPPADQTDDVDLKSVATTKDSAKFAEAYRKLTPEQRAQLRAEYNLTNEQQVEAFLVDTVSTGVGSAEWQSRYNEMSTDAKIEYIDRYGGQVPSSIPQEASVDVRNQTYSSYDGSFLIKPDTGSVDTSMKCTYDWCNSDPAGRDVLMNNAQEIRKSGEAMFGRLDSETATFTSTMNAVDNNRNLTAEQKETIKAYLQEQINARNAVSDTIKKDLQNDEHTYTLSNGSKTSSDDGIVGDWTHVNSDGSNKVGFNASYSYKQVEGCVDKWQTNYNGLTDYDYTKAYLATYGIFI